MKNIFLISFVTMAISASAFAETYTSTKYHGGAGWRSGVSTLIPLTNVCGSRDFAELLEEAKISAMEDCRNAGANDCQFAGATRQNGDLGCTLTASVIGTKVTRPILNEDTSTRNQETQVSTKEPLILKCKMEGRKQFKGDNLEEMYSIDLNNREVIDSQEQVGHIASVTSFSLHLQYDSNYGPLDIYIDRITSKTHYKLNDSKDDIFVGRCRKIDNKF